jgi:hypothetical protein
VPPGGEGAVFGDVAGRDAADDRGIVQAADLMTQVGGGGAAVAVGLTV